MGMPGEEWKKVFLARVTGHLELNLDGFNGWLETTNEIPPEYINSIDFLSQQNLTHQNVLLQMTQDDFGAWFLSLSEGQQRTLSSSKCHKSSVLIRYAQKYIKRLEAFRACSSNFEQLKSWLSDPNNLEILISCSLEKIFIPNSSREEKLALANKLLKYFIVNPEKNSNNAFLFRQWIKNSENFAIIQQLDVKELLSGEEYTPEVKKNIGILVSEIVNNCVEASNTDDARMIAFASWVYKMSNEELLEFAEEEKKPLIVSLKENSVWVKEIARDLNLLKNGDNALLEKVLASSSLQQALLNEYVKVKQPGAFIGVRPIITAVSEIKKIKDKEGERETKEESIRHFLMPTESVDENLGIRLKLLRKEFPSESYPSKYYNPSVYEKLELEAVIRFYLEPLERISNSTLDILVGDLERPETLSIIVAVAINSSLDKLIKKNIGKISLLPPEVLERLRETKKLKTTKDGESIDLRELFKNLVSERNELTQELIRTPFLLPKLCSHVVLKGSQQASRKNRFLYVLEQALKEMDSGRMETFAQQAAFNIINNGNENDITIVLVAFEEVGVNKEFRWFFEHYVKESLSLSDSVQLLDKKQLTSEVKEAVLNANFVKRLRAITSIIDIPSILSEYNQLKNWKKGFKVWVDTLKSDKMLEKISEWLQNQDSNFNTNDSIHIIRHAFGLAKFPKDEYVWELIDAFGKRLITEEKNPSSLFNILEVIEASSSIERNHRVIKYAIEWDTPLSIEKLKQLWDSRFYSPSEMETFIFSSSPNASGKGEPLSFEDMVASPGDSWINTSSSSPRNISVNTTPTKSTTFLGKKSHSKELLFPNKPVEATEEDKQLLVKWVENFLKNRNAKEEFSLDVIVELFEAFPGGFEAAYNVIEKDKNDRAHNEKEEHFYEKEDHFLTLIAEHRDALKRSSLLNNEAYLTLATEFITIVDRRQRITKKINEEKNLNANKPFFLALIDAINSGNITIEAIFEYFPPEDSNWKKILSDSTSNHFTILNACINYFTAKCGHEFLMDHKKNSLIDIYQIVGVKNLWAKLLAEYNVAGNSAQKSTFIDAILNDINLIEKILTPSAVESDCSQFFSADYLQQQLIDNYCLTREEKKKNLLQVFIRAWFKQALAGNDSLPSYIPDYPETAGIKVENFKKLCDVIDIPCLWQLLKKEIDNPSRLRNGENKESIKQKLIKTLKHSGIKAKVFGAGIADTGINCVEIFSLEDIKGFIEEYQAIKTDLERVADKEALVSFIKLWFKLRLTSCNENKALWQVISQDEAINSKFFDLSKALHQMPELLQVDRESSAQLNEVKETINSYKAVENVSSFEEAKAFRVVGYGSPCKWIMAAAIESDLWAAKRDINSFKDILVNFKNQFKAMDNVPEVRTAITNVYNTLCFALNMGGQNTKAAFEVFIEDEEFFAKLHDLYVGNRVSADEKALIKKMLQALFMANPAGCLKILSQPERVNQWYFTVKELEIYDWVKQETGPEKIKRERERRRDGITARYDAHNQKVGWLTSNTFDKSSLIASIPESQKKWIRNNFDDHNFERNNPDYKARAARYTSWSGLQWLWNTFKKVSKGVSSCYGVSAVVPGQSQYNNNDSDFIFKTSAGECNDQELEKRIINLQVDLGFVDLLARYENRGERVDTRYEEERFDNALEFLKPQGFRGFFKASGLTALNKWIDTTSVQNDINLPANITAARQQLKDLIAAAIKLKRVNSKHLNLQKIQQINEILYALNNHIEKSSKCTKIQEVLLGQLDSFNNTSNGTIGIENSLSSDFELAGIPLSRVSSKTGSFSFNRPDSPSAATLGRSVADSLKYLREQSPVGYGYTSVPLKETPVANNSGRCTIR